jgi:heat shock protein HslJ
MRSNLVGPGGSSTPDDLVRPVAQARPRWMLIASVAALVALAAAVTGYLLTRPGGHATTQVGGPGSRPAIVGPAWQLSRIVDTDGHVIDALPTRLRIQSHSLTGTDGCNGFSATVTVTSRAVTLDGPVARTEILCAALRSGRPQARTMTAVDRFFDASFNWRIENGDLILSRPGTDVLIYEHSRDAVVDPAAITATWRLTGIEHDTSTGGTAEGSGSMHTLVTFDVSGRVRIEHRCYVNTADAAFGTGTLDITHVVLDSATPCPALPDEQDEQRVDQTVDEVLTGAVAWHIDQDTLAITKGGTALTFAKV